MTMPDIDFIFAVLDRFFITPGLTIFFFAQLIGLVGDRLQGIK
jgi:hypothetical protein